MISFSTSSLFPYRGNPASLWGIVFQHRLSQMVKATQWSPIFCVAKPISTDLFFSPMVDMTEPAYIM